MRWWNLINKALFDGKLTAPQKITVKAFRNEWGSCYPFADKGCVHLRINSEFFDRKTFLAVLVHEMVHQWQWTDEQAKGIMKHGPTFWLWEERIKKTLGLPLHISY